MPADPEAFVRAHTAAVPAPFVPELRLHLATELTPLWEATEAWLAARDVAPPFWAFVWAGSQALARWVLDQPDAVRGRRVLDFASGSGVSALAAARAGGLVTANELDPMAGAAVRVNAAANAVAVSVHVGDLVGTPPGGWDVVLAGDVCYERHMTARVLPWLAAQAATGAAVYLADPGRAFLPARGLEALARYRVPTSVEADGVAWRDTTIYRLYPEVVG